MLTAHEATEAQEIVPNADKRLGYIRENAPYRVTPPSEKSSMVDKSERVESADQKKGYVDQVEPEATEADNPNIGADTDGNDIEELSQEEISALITPVADEQIDDIPEELPQDEDTDQLSNQNSITDEENIQLKPPEEMASDPKNVNIIQDRELERDSSDKSVELEGSEDNQIDESDPFPKNDPHEERDDEEKTSNIVATDGPETNDDESTRRKHHAKHLKVLGAILVGCLILTGLWGVNLYRNQKSVHQINSNSQPVVAETTDSPVPIIKETSIRSETLSSGESQPNPLQENQSQLNKIRNSLLAKAQVLTDLQDQYRSGVDRFEEEMITKIRNSDIETLNQALQDNRVKFQLHTIQRRQAYIEQLEGPIRWLKEGSENLLFLQRKHDIELVVLSVCRDITADKILAESDDMIRRFTTGSIEEHLEVDLKTARLLPVEQIWQSLISTAKKTNIVTVKSKIQNHDLNRSQSKENEQTDTNQLIWEEICAGKFERKHDLTALSSQAAECLAAWEEPDLFINQVANLTPDATQELLKWKGKWLGLNGLIELSPETASYLFNWEGEWVSLNGLIYMNSESSAYLSKWTGHTLEMMGLSSELMARDSLALKHLSKWMGKGNRLYVPDDIRHLIMSQ